MQQFAVQTPEGPRWFDTMLQAQRWAERHNRTWLAIQVGREIIVLQRHPMPPKGHKVWVLSTIADSPDCG